MTRRSRRRIRDPNAKYRKEFWFNWITKGAVVTYVSEPINRDERK